MSTEPSTFAKDQFLANLSHELRTPLNAILGWTHIMKNARQDEALIGQGLDVLQRNTNTLIELISALVDTSHIVAGTLTMVFQEVDLKRAVRASVENLRVQAEEKNIAMDSVIKIPEEVNCTVWGDEARLHQILGNLLSNALKFTPFGGSVSVQLRKEQASALITVKDSGKGISAEFLPLIFNRFSRDDASTVENCGLGLGLAICKHLVELHNGTIVAESKGPGCGAAIKVELPTIASEPQSSGGAQGDASQPPF
jgi:signal transduction histidine kinase